MPGSTAPPPFTKPLRSCSTVCWRPTYRMFVLAGYRLVDVPSPDASSVIPSRSNSVYSTFVMPNCRRVSHSPCTLTLVTFSWMSTFMPSAAPTARSQEAKPKAWSRWEPVPASASNVVSVPARGLLICRTRAALRPAASIQSNTPLSAMSFQITPWPPGLRSGENASGSNHLPSSTLTTGTSGWQKRLNEPGERPKCCLACSSSVMRLWLPLASLVMTAMGVVICRPKIW
mmetsp:Transcript_2619/g.6879  ORF Transcript_2619/g.6879 Transcript_2619/m.6879 type:complete len:230 (+) Transcript_2619:1148-1837(+)